MAWDDKNIEKDRWSYRPHARARGKNYGLTIRYGSTDAEGNVQDRDIEPHRLLLAEDQEFARFQYLGRNCFHIPDHVVAGITPTLARPRGPVYLRTRYWPQATGVLQRWEIANLGLPVFDVRHFSLQYVRSNSSGASAAVYPTKRESLLRLRNRNSEFVKFRRRELRSTVGQQLTVLGGKEFMNSSGSSRFDSSSSLQAESTHCDWSFIVDLQTERRQNAREVSSQSHKAFRFRATRSAAAKHKSRLESEWALLHKSLERQVAHLTLLVQELLVRDDRRAEGDCSVAGGAAATPPTLDDEAPALDCYTRVVCHQWVGSVLDEIVRPSKSITGGLEVFAHQVERLLRFENAYDNFEDAFRQSTHLLEYGWLVEELVTLLSEQESSLCFPETLWLLDKIVAVLHKSTMYWGFSPFGEEFNSPTRMTVALGFYEQVCSRIGGGSTEGDEVEVAKTRRSRDEVEETKRSRDEVEVAKTRRSRDEVEVAKTRRSGRRKASLMRRWKDRIVQEEGLVDGGGADRDRESVGFSTCPADPRGWVIYNS